MFAEVVALVQPPPKNRCGTFNKVRVEEEKINYILLPTVLENALSVGL